MALLADPFALRINPVMTHFRTGGTNIGYKLVTELFPNNAVNSNGTILGQIINCAQLCAKYLYCTTFSYNRATNECRFVVAMNATSNATALMVESLAVLYIYNFIFRPTADSTRTKLRREEIYFEQI
jgi:hypothetical protein